MASYKVQPPVKRVVVLSLDEDELRDLRESMYSVGLEEVVMSSVWDAINNAYHESFD